MSPVVEADPDVAAAMDILSFALYHENNEVIDEAQNALNRKRQRETPISDSSDTEDAESAEKDPKRQAVSSEATSSAPDSGMVELKRTIYEQVSKASDGSVSVSNLCEATADRELVMQAVQSLEADGKIMLADDEVYLID